MQATKSQRSQRCSSGVDVSRKQGMNCGCSQRARTSHAADGTKTSRTQATPRIAVQETSNSTISLVQQRNGRQRQRSKVGGAARPRGRGERGGRGRAKSGVVFSRSDEPSKGQSEAVREP
ncbi:hypothetical protein BCV70DRAFT_50780 [Testicularia cyperi]|uniref:Uncharacterized protein n=1 Tax=Testicularia cyperi TaxID=1882483 RepID=A0A317XI85_9BASI|nr:hypothetical protein BCV70DRAFT_50780 [Testicularia cyperi]